MLKVLPAHRVRRVTLAPLVLPAPLAHKALRVTLAQPDRLERKVLLVRLAHRDRKARLEPKVLLALRDRRAIPVLLAPQVRKVPKVTPARPALLERLARKALPDLRDSRATLVHPDRLDLRVRRVLKDPLACRCFSRRLR